jgi:Xaa-Pro aminopeptidase
MDDAYPIEDLDEILPGLLEGRSRVYYHFGRDAEFDLKLIGWVNRVRAQIKQGAQPPHEFLELGPPAARPAPVQERGRDAHLMRRAAEISVPRRTARDARGAPGHPVRVRDRKPNCSACSGATTRWPAYEQHRRRRRQRLRAALPRQQCAQGADGDLVLIDAGAEFRTMPRTSPAPSRSTALFSPPQRAIYQLVLDAQAARHRRRASRRKLDRPARGRGRVLTDGLLRLGLLKGTLAQCLKEQSYRRFYMHKTGHWLGLDVHDVGDYRIDGESACSNRAWCSRWNPASTSRPAARASRPSGRASACASRTMWRSRRKATRY